MHLAWELRDLDFGCLHPAVPREGFQRVFGHLLDSLCQQVLVCVEITCRLRHRDAPLAHEPNRLDLNSRLKLRYSIRHLRFHYDP
jgi:hypothetical protein